MLSREALLGCRAELQHTTHAHDERRHKCLGGPGLRRDKEENAVEGQGGLDTLRGSLVHPWHKTERLQGGAPSGSLGEGRM